MSVREQIIQQREDFARVRSQIRLASSKIPRINQMQLRQGSKQPLMGRLRTRRILTAKETIKKATLELEKKQEQFETEVAYVEPSLAKEKYLEIVSKRRKGRRRGRQLQYQRERSQSGRVKIPVKSVRSLNAPELVEETYYTIKGGGGGTTYNIGLNKYYTDESGKLIGVGDIISTESRIPSNLDKISFQSVLRTQERIRSGELPTGRQSLLSGEVGIFYKPIGESKGRLIPSLEFEKIRAREELSKPVTGTISQRIGGYLGKSEAAIQYGKTYLTQKVPLKSTVTVSQLPIGESQVSLVVPSFTPLSFNNKFITLPQPNQAGTPTINPITTAITRATSIPKPSSFGFKKVMSRDIYATEAIDLGTWFIPYVGTARATSFVAGTTGKVIKREFVSPLEVGVATGITLLGVRGGFKWLKPKLTTKEYSVVKQVTMPKSEQVVIYAPKLKKQFWKLTEGEVSQATLKSKSVGLTIGSVDTGLIKFNFIKKPFRKLKLKSAKKIEFSTLGTTEEVGFIKMLPLRQAEVFRSGLIRDISGAKLSGAMTLGRGGGVRLDSRSIVKGGKVFSSETLTSARGLSKSKVSLSGRRLQRTGEVSGFSKNILKGEVKNVPVSVQEEIGIFKSLYKKEPTAFSRGETLVVGQPEGIKNLVDISFEQRSIIQQSKTAKSSQLLQDLYGVKPSSQQIIQSPIKQPKISQATATASPVIAGGVTDKPIPSEWLGVYDIKEPVLVTEVGTSSVSLLPTTSTGLGSTKFDTDIREDTRINEKQKEKTKQSQKTKQKEKTDQLTQLGLKSDILSRDALRERIKQRQRIGLISKSQLDLGLRQTTTTTTTQRTPTTPRIPKRPAPQLPFPSGKTTPTLEGKNILVRGFDVYVKRKGKWIKVSRKTLTRTGALKLGSERVRRTLAASFKIVETPQKVAAKRKGFFKPSPNIFRSYKVVKGRKVGLKDTFIQKASKRLSGRGEVGEIQRARKTKWL